MSTPTPLDLAALRATAEAATPGPWIIDELETGEHGLFVDEDNPDYQALGCGLSQVAGFLEGKNARHIAAFDPPTVIQLLDQIDILSRNVELTRHQRGEQQARATTAEAAIARVREVHTRTYTTVDNEVWGRDPRCSECHDAYPCPTIQSLGGE